jgi:membrane-bound lytic murein transglycosylase D
MRIVYILFCSFLFVSNTIEAQSKDSLLLSATFQRIGFSSLFTITSSGDKDKPFQFQLNPKAVSFIQAYMEKQGPALLKMKTWARPYFNLYDQILIANGVPVELKYLSVIESSLSSNIVSWAGAVGPWQIMPEEAKRLGLKLLPTDERTDYEKSTQAAATILRESFAEFGDWLLVVAAYNGGAGRVRQAMKKKNTKDFWELQYELPLETRNHVKKFIATQYVFESDGNWTTLTQNEASQKEQVSKTKGNENPNQNISSLTIRGRYKATIIAAFVEMSMQEMNILNPNLDKLLSSGNSYDLKLPLASMEKFKARKNEILQASIQSLYQTENK